MSQSSEEVHHLARLLSEYSPSGEEEKAQGEVLSLLTSKGFENVRKDIVGNVLGEKGDGDKTLLFCSHIDTVPGQISVKTESGRIWGRGAVDAKASLLAMIIAASNYRSQRIRLVFSSVVEEEGDSKGVKYLLEKIPPPDYVLIGEPTGMRTAAIAYRGSAMLKISVTTKGGHASSPLEENNAILQIFKLMDFLKTRFTFSKDGFSNIGLTVTMLKGGYGDSRIPEGAEAVLNLRYPPHTRFKELSKTVPALLKEYVESNKLVLNIVHDFGDHVDGYASVKDEGILKAVRNAVKSILGKDLLLIRKLGTSDFNYTGLKWGRPQLAWGPGDPSLAHSLEESISVEEFLLGIKMYENFLNNLSSMNC